MYMNYIKEDYNNMIKSEYNVNIFKINRKK